MNVRPKMLLAATALVLIPLAVTAFLLWRNASNLAGGTIEKLTETQLTALRDLKARQISSEVESRVSALQLLAAQRSTVDSMKQFKAGFSSSTKDYAKPFDIAKSQARASEFITKEFNAEFAKRNPGAAPDLSAFVAGRTREAVLLQQLYIFDNPAKLGEKSQLNAAEGDFAYNRTHALYHPGLERAQKLQGFYDIFMVDVDTDTVVYTVFKELDFATRLAPSTDIAAKSKLAEAYQQAKQMRAGQVYLSDFEPYLASFNDQAAFLSTPIFEGEKLVGVLMAQYPIDKITSTLSSDRLWERIGLGKSGDVFMVGGDFLMRSDARYLLETKESFLALLKDRLTPAALQTLTKKDSSIGIVKIESDATRAALAGKLEYLRFVDYRGIECFGAVTPIKLQGQLFALVAKIDIAEALEPIDNLRQQTLTAAALLALAALVIAGVAIFFAVNRFMQPISKLRKTVADVNSGSLDARAKLSEQDEIGELGRAFDGLLDERITELKKASAENESLNNNVITLLQTVFQLSSKDLTVRAPVGEDVIGTLASSINQLSDETGRALAQVQRIATDVRNASESIGQQAVRVDNTNREERVALEAMALNLNAATQQLAEVATLSERSSRAAVDASSATQSALDAVAGTVSGMENLRDSIVDTEKRFAQLGERSQEISTAVRLIYSISERTHVLAVNASMQAAAAGEAGRGFAVVADEVQRLAESSRKATGQISQLVQNIQADTGETLFTMSRLIKQVVEQATQAQKAGVQMNLSQNTTEQLIRLVQQIGSLSEVQAQLAGELRASVTKLGVDAQETTDAIEQQSESSLVLMQYSEQLTQAVSQFKLPAAA
jgi:methyl-accepting chemotaxis protein